MAVMTPKYEIALMLYLMQHDQEYQELAQDIQTEVLTLTHGDLVAAEDVMIPVELLQRVVARHAYLQGAVDTYNGFTRVLQVRTPVHTELEQLGGPPAPKMTAYEVLRLLEAQELRRRVRELQQVQHYTAWTYNPLLVKQHEKEFLPYLEQHYPTLRKALLLLEAGHTLAAVARQLGFGHRRKLQRELQHAFSEFLDKPQLVNNTPLCAFC